jgi:spermidine/putrescine transport system substrate-binding protein
MSNVRTYVWKGLTALVSFSLLLAACSNPAAAPTVVPTTAPQPTAAAPTVAPATTAPEATAAPTTAPATAAPPTAPAAAFVSKPSGQSAPSGFACPEPQPKMELTSKEVNLFVWTAYIPQDIIDCFQLVYGIKVNRDEYDSNESMYAKLSQSSVPYDLVQPTNNYVSLLVRQKLIQKLDKSKLTIMGNFGPSYLNLSFDPNNEYTLPYEAGTDAIVYNADVVKTPPQSFADLFKPEYKDYNMIMLDGAHDIIGATLVSLGYDINTKDPKQLDEAKAKLLELRPSIKVFDSNSPKTPLISGDVALGIIWTGDAFLAAQQNPAIKYVYPKEGAVIWQDNYAIPAVAGHLDAAYAWLNYSNQPDLFWLMLRDWPYTNPNQSALDYANVSGIPIKDLSDQDTTSTKLYEAYINSPVTNTPPDDLKAAHWLDDLGDAAPLYEKVWTEVKGSQ